MTIELTFVIPVAPHHARFLPRAIESVQAQTVKCKAMYLVDKDEHGAGWTRNRILERVDTPYVSFLDADDWLEPTFAEECLTVIRPGHYVYTDWYEDDNHKIAPNKAWCHGAWHVINALLYTEDAQRVGGFDETLPAIEDTDFFLKLTSKKVCGIHVGMPLMHYSTNGLRSRKVHESGQVIELKKQVLRRYANTMGCCGDDNGYDNTTPVGERQEGDVLAMAMWAGNKRTIGKATGRRYPRMSYPKKTWVDPRDIARESHMWERVSSNEPVEQVQYQGIDGVVQGMRDVGAIRTPPPPKPPTVAASFEDFNPDVVNVINLAKRGMK